MRRAAWLALACLAACAEGHDADWRCEDGRRLAVTFVSPETIALGLDGERRSLTRVRSASGAKYADAGAVFWLRGPDALLETPGKMTRCLRPSR